MDKLTTEQAVFAQKFVGYLDKLLGESLADLGKDDKTNITFVMKRLLGTAIRNNILSKYESLEIRDNKDVSVLVHFTQGMAIWVDLIYGS
jgi:hypothetical protein